MLGQAYGKVATVGNATSGFMSTGLWPPNRHVFPEYYLFSPSSVTGKLATTSPAAITAIVDCCAKEQEETVRR